MLKELEKLDVPLELNEGDRVKEVLCLLMMARQGLATMVHAVQNDMRKRVEGGATMNMELLFKSMQAQNKWTQQRTKSFIQTGRGRFNKAALLPEEVLGLCLYTGPQFMYYNCMLRKFPVALVESLKDNTYTTTIHCINSAIVKFSRAWLSPRPAEGGARFQRLAPPGAVCRQGQAGLPWCYGDGLHLHYHQPSGGV